MHNHTDPSDALQCNSPEETPVVETLTAKFAVGHCENIVVFSAESGMINLAITMGTDNAEELCRQLLRTVAIIKHPSNNLEVVR